jgi:uncharacterized radical SAM superfamily Fe-S cluster-containing enzyme
MGEVIGETKSLCPICLSLIEAHRVIENGQVFLVKECPDHGLFKVPVWDDAKYYSKVEGYDHPKVMPQVFEEWEGDAPSKMWDPSQQLQSTCLTVVEVTTGCNLRCPYCFASSETSQKIDLDLETIRRMFTAVSKKVKKPIVVQISGGEPTIREDLPEIVAMAKGLKIDFIQLNTNGVRLAKDESYAGIMKKAGVDSVYLGFDSFDREVLKKISGVDLLDIKLKAIENCRRAGLPIELVPKIIPGLNVDQIGKIIEFAKKNIGIIKGVHFQPISYFGRVPAEPKDENYITIPALLREIEKQTGGEITPDDFIPTGCADVHCDTKCFGFISEGKFISLTKMSGKFSPELDITKTVREGVYGSWGNILAKEAGLLDGDQPMTDKDCGCGTWMGLVKDLTLNALTISAMHFQDAWNIDYGRLRNCCIHEVMPDGRFVPFCLFNASDVKGRAPFREMWCAQYKK